MRKWFMWSVLVLAVLAFAPSVDAAKATLSWTDASNNEDGFNIERKPVLCAAAGTWGPLSQVGKDSVGYEDQAVSEGASYCYRVNAYNTAGASAWSNEAGITIAYTVPQPPSGAIMAQNTLKWTDNSGNETGFVIERQVGPNGFAVLATVPKDTTSYEDKAVVEGQTYTYRVAATNPAGQSAWSNTAQRTVPWTVPSAPSGLVIQ